MSVVIPKGFVSPASPAPLQGLRETVRRLERGTFRADRAGVSIGLPAIDEVLGEEGLAPGGLHEVMTGRPGKGDRIAAHDGATLAFASLLLGRFGARQGATGGRILWCRRAGSGFDAAPYPPALAGFLDPARLLMVHVHRNEDALWALEESLRCPSLAAVLGEVEGIDHVAGRRLQLAAERSGVPAILLRPGDRPAVVPGITATRWRITSAPLARTGPVALHDRSTACWRLELLRRRGGDPARTEIPTWTVEWIDETHRLALVSATGDRPVGTPPAAPVAEPPGLPSRARLAG